MNTIVIWYLLEIMTHQGFLFHALVWIGVLVKNLTHWGWVAHICIGNLTIIGSDNCHLENWEQTSVKFIQENAYENVIRKLVAILSQPQCVKDFNFGAIYVMDHWWCTDNQRTTNLSDLFEWMWYQLLLDFIYSISQLIHCIYLFYT